MLAVSQSPRGCGMLAGMMPSASSTPPTAAPGLHPRGFPLLLEAAFRLWRRSLPATLPLALPIALLDQVQRIELPTLDALQTDPDLLLDWIAPAFEARTWWLFALLGVAALWLHAALLTRLAGLHVGRASPLGQALWRGLQRLPAVLASVVVYAALCALPLLPMLALMSWIGLQGLDLPALMAVSVLLSLLFAMPVAWLAIRFMLAPYAAALDGCAPAASLRRAARAVAGHWWLAMAYVSMPLLVFLAVGTLSAAAPMLQALLPAGVAGLDTALAWGSRVLSIVGIALAWPLLHASLVVLYSAGAEADDPLPAAR